MGGERGTLVIGFIADVVRLSNGIRIILRD